MSPLHPTAPAPETAPARLADVVGAVRAAGLLADDLRDGEGDVEIRGMTNEIGRAHV